MCKPFYQITYSTLISDSTFWGDKSLGEIPLAVNIAYRTPKKYLYKMILFHPYQNPINERHVCKNNYSLTRLSFVSGVVIF